ncbi:MAG TPA: YbaK/EbsC family protein [Tepidisphaeraceae bacterium]|nr:YbaK/EbsC family protein [Tepidisphaeraceae bacterium]
MNVQSFLDEMGIAYRSSCHPTAYTAQDLASAEHVPGRQVIKPVVVKADGRFVMCALPASHRVDLSALREQLEAENLSLADETKLRELFPDCELGAEPPIGRLYDMPTIMDESLIADARVTFQAGTHRDAVTMSLADYRRAAQPEMGYFGRHV